MSIKLRPYQLDVKQQTVDNIVLPEIVNTVVVMPCGSGKTVLFSNLTDEFDGAVSLIVHRQELVAQISLTLAAFNITHDILSPRNVIAAIVRQHVKKFGRSFYSARSNKKVGGVDTIIRRKDHEFDKWRKRVGLWVQDEAHHVLKDNKWGKAAYLFPNAKGVGVTATPERADGKGLGIHADGLFHTMVEGPDLAWMIDQGYLTDHLIYAPPSDVDYSGLKPTASGDYNSKALRAREEKSHIFGDVVSHFLRIAEGKQGITFASSIKSAIDFASEFNRAGVKARMVSGETSDRERTEADTLFRRGELSQLTNVDLFGEGYDLPILDCVTMARKTLSFALFVQQSTRALRPAYADNMPLDTREQRRAAIAAGPKPIAYIIDHVGNVERHAVFRNGRIDLCYRQWSLDAREKRSSKGGGAEIPVKNCVNPMCAATYEAILPACPYCGDTPKPAQRKEPQHVDGDLTQLDPSALKQIVSEVERINAPFHQKGLSVHSATNARRHELKRQVAQTLQESIANWMGIYRAKGESDQVICKRFYYTFGVDHMSCQTGSKDDLIKMTEKVNSKLNEVF